MWRLLYVGVACSVLSCAQSERPSAEPVVGLERASVDEAVPAPSTQQAIFDEVGTASLLPPPQHRTRQRMNLDQLQRSLSAVMGGLEWTTNGKSEWASRASTLGVPDYMSSVRENLSSNLLFDKTLGDAARDLCPALLEKEKDATPEDRVFLLDVGPDDTFVTNDSGMRSTLRRLILLYHGRNISEEEPAFAPWLNLLTNLMTTAETPVHGWTALCVALAVHPEFQSY